MPIKDDSPGERQVVDQWEGGVGWISHPNERMRRTSHALSTDAGVFLIDPLDAPDLDELLTEYGSVAGVVVLFNYHRRDAETLARRYDIPVYVPSWFSGVASNLDVPVERFDGRLPGTGFELLDVADELLWKEAALWDGETLVVAESVGTADYFLAPGEQLGVSLVRRLVPPRVAFAGMAPERLLCGHGEGLFSGADIALEAALDNARRAAPRLYLERFPLLVRMLYSAQFH